MEIERRIRWYQQPLHSYMVNGGLRAIEVAHRRWGKDEVALDVTSELSYRRPATYWHCLPEYNQARKAIWTAINAHTGKRRIDEAFPHEIRESTNEQEMFIKFKWGSTWQVIGSDRYNSLVGAGVAGVVFSEWALANPAAWGYISPMMNENNGWAMFITTPRGNNHAKKMYDTYRKDPDCFAEISTIEDTRAFSGEQLVKIRQEYIDLYGEDFGVAQFEQEYFCSFDAAIMGSYYGAEIAKATKEGRITNVAWDEALPVFTVWDIGYSDDTCILFFQVLRGEVRVIDAYSASGRDIAHYAETIKAKPYRYARHWLPHDAQAKMLVAAGRSMLEQLKTDHGIKYLAILPNKNTEQQGIMAARHLFPRLWVDEDKCADFLSAIRNFRREWDDERKCFRDKPHMDWTNHYADTLRYLAWVWQEPAADIEPPEPKRIVVGGKSTMTLDDLYAQSRQGKGSRL